MYTGLHIYVTDSSQEQHVRSFNKGIINTATKGKYISFIYVCIMHVINFAHGRAENKGKYTRLLCIHYK